jgi:hypothetical protein
MKVSIARWWSGYDRTAMTLSTWPSCLPALRIQQANARSAVLLTADKDFGELVFRQGLVHSGVVLLRLAGLANATKAEIVAEVCRDRTAELIGAFSVISPGQVRIRRKS